MTREQAEAVIWENAAALTSKSTPARNAAMEEILDAVDAYATAQCAVAISIPDATQYENRRAILLAAVARRRISPRKAAS